MFNWRLFIVLVLICVPGLVVSAPRLIRSMQRTIVSNAPPGRTLPSTTVLATLVVLQNLAIVAVAAAVGTALAPRVGLRAPFFEALVSGESLWPALAPQILPTLLLGTAGALAFVASYYLYVRPRLDEQTLRSTEKLRMSLGVWSRLLYGGIVEEVLIRWGLMTLLVWLGALVVGKTTSGVVWAAIVTAGVLFGLGHLPANLAAGAKKTRFFIGVEIGLNLWAALIFGWLFWQYGLVAAMLAHMLFHLIWLPFELRVYRPAGRQLAT
jgi:hypothetical protein